MPALSYAFHQVLYALYRLHLAKPSQVCRALYTYPGSIRYAEDNLLQLAKRGYAHREIIPNANEFGRAPIYYTLSHNGMKHLVQTEQLPKRRVYRLKDATGEDTVHKLSITDFLVHALAFTKHTPDFRITRAHHERELRELHMEVTLSTGKKRAVTPDAWVDMQSATRNVRYCLALELQRTVIEQKRWTGKIEGLLVWAKTTMPPIMQTREVTFPFVATSTADTATLVRKTELALTQLKAREWGSLFCFWGGNLETVATEELFLSPLWYQPFVKAPGMLLEGL